MKMRIYYNSVLGALGGLVSWGILGQMGEFTSVIFRDIVYGIAVGGCVGAAIGCIDGIFDRSLAQGVRGAVRGVGYGAVGGVAGLLIGELVLWVIGGGIGGRAVGWAIIGLAVGITEGVANRASKKINYGLIGGTLGGFFGGAIFEFLRQNFGSYAFSQALGLIILGACIGFLIGLVEDILRVAWLMVINGRQEGREFTLAKKTNLIGRDENCDVPLFGDAEVLPQHAQIRVEPERFILFGLKDAAGKLWVNEHLITSEVALANNDRLKVGNTKLVFRWKEKIKVS
ncbi:MAG: FHA domain-containing protein [Desulfobaccales bacterium]